MTPSYHPHHRLYSKDILDEAVLGAKSGPGWASEHFAACVLGFRILSSSQTY